MALPSRSGRDEGQWQWRQSQCRLVLQPCGCLPPHRSFRPIGRPHHCAPCHCWTHRHLLAALPRSRPPVPQTDTVASPREDQLRSGATLCDQISFTVNPIDETYADRVRVVLPLIRLPAGATRNRRLQIPKLNHQTRKLNLQSRLPPDRALQALSRMMEAATVTVKAIVAGARVATLRSRWSMRSEWR